MLVQNDRELEASRAAGGSLGKVLMQDGDYTESNPHTVRQIMHQGPSNKRDPLVHAPVGRVLGQ
jgi:hypothetical protein